MLSNLSVEDLRQVILSLPVATCVLDRETRYVAASEKYAAMLGAPFDALTGRAMTDFCPVDLEESTRRDFQTFDQGERVADHEIMFRGNAYLVSVNPLYRGNGNSASAVSVSLTDISALKRLEAANQRLTVAYQQAKAHAETDTLTGLLNRYGLQTIFAKEIARARRGRYPIALAMIDADWFKSYNDSNGHIAGDAALKAVGKAIRSAIRRPGDWGARYGGEEFCVLLPNTDLDGGHHVGLNIQREVNALAIAHPGSAFGCLTVSIGIAGIDSIARDAPVEIVSDLMLRQADKALYAAKAAGRNTVRICHSD